MNVAEPPAVALPPQPPPPVASEPPFDLRKLLLGLLLAVGAFDVCFWGVRALGFSVGVFVPVLAGAILFNRENPWRRTTVLIGGLLAGACFVAMIETGVTNTLTILILVTALAGDSYFDGGWPAWARWFTQTLVLIFAPGRIFWLAVWIVEVCFGRARGPGLRLIAGTLLAFPALALALTFGALLASGNAIFGAWTGDFFNWLGNEIAAIFDFARIAMWFFVAFAVLPLLRPAMFGERWWAWIPKLPRLAALVPADGALFSSALVLVVLNVLFAVANVADAMFLWSKGNTLPSGVTYSGYVHSGVNALTLTVLLSAVVLAGIFQQQLAVAGRRGLKALGLLWIAQNLFVLISVVLRLKLYIEAYDMTVARLSVIIFLLLVAAGYGLLTIQIAREKSLPWLVGGCAVAIFATFYVTQFLNLAGWSADYNVARWEGDRTRSLDMDYIYSLGPAAWPALQRAGHDGEYAWSTWDSVRNEKEDRQLSAADQERSLPRTEFDASHWREFSLRAYWNRWALEDKK